jgi:DNA primase
MKRYSENLMLVLDADAAGLSATAKSAALALRAGLRVKAARLPKGKDPADLVREDPKEFAKRIKDGKPIVEFFLTELSEREKDPHRLLRLVEAVVLPLISAMQSPMEREHFVTVTARSLGLSPEAVRESLSRIPSTASYQVPPAASREPSPTAPRATRELQVLALINVYKGTPLAEKVKSAYSRITEAPALPPDAVPEQVLFETERTFGESPDEGAADELLQAFEESVIRDTYEEAVRELRRAEASGDAPLIRTAAERCSQLSARLAVLRK